MKKTYIDERIGHSVRQNCGLDCTCIVYQNCHDADFLFEDGYIAEHKKYSDFENGKIGHPTMKKKKLQQKAAEKYIGQEKTTPTGYPARIIEYLGKNEKGVIRVRIEWLDDHTKKIIDVGSWKDNTFAKDDADRRYRLSTRVRENSEKAKAEILNHTRPQRNGLLCTCLEYIRANRIKCRFNDESQYEVWTTVENFRNGTVPYIEDSRTYEFKKKHKPGEENVNNQGLSMTIYKINNSKDIDVLFTEDGKIREHVSYQKFANGSLAHPNFPTTNSTSNNELVLLYYLEPFGFCKKKIGEEPIKEHEFDLYNSEKKIAIEYDGSRFHENKSERDLDKLKKCKEAGIKIFRIREEGLNIRQADDFVNYGNAYINIDATLSELFAVLRRDYVEFEKLPEPNFSIERNAIYQFIVNYRRNDRHIGEERKMKNGQMAKILGYTRTGCIIRFEDGTKVIGTYGNFQQGNIGNPNYTAAQYNRDIRKKELEKEFVGKSIEIPEYNTTAKILAVKNIERWDGNHMQRGWYFSVIYSNGFTEDVSEKRLRSGHLAPSDCGHLHEKNTSLLGDEMEIIAYHNSNDITVRFASGTIREHVKYANFRNGSIGDIANTSWQRFREKRKKELEEMYIGKFVQLPKNGGKAAIVAVKCNGHNDGKRMQYKWFFTVVHSDGEKQDISECVLEKCTFI